MVFSKAFAAEEAPHPEYPYLGIFTGPNAKTERPLIVLFEAEGCGTVVVSDGEWPIGSYSKGWSRKGFVPWYGTVTLSN